MESGHWALQRVLGGMDQSAGEAPDSGKNVYQTSPASTCPPKKGEFLEQIADWGRVGHGLVWPHFRSFFAQNIPLNFLHRL